MPTLNYYKNKSKHLRNYKVFCGDTYFGNIQICKNKKETYIKLTKINSVIKTINYTEAILLVNLLDIAKIEASKFFFDSTKLFCAIRKINGTNFNLFFN